MRYAFAAILLLVVSAVPAHAEISLGISVPGVQIGINMPVYPDLVPVPGYPVYYDPRASSNYFFYDGLYWVYEGDSWYASDWYDGPWRMFQPEYVPLFVLRVPVQYYRRAPPYFRGWADDAPPRWGEHWGRSWEDRHGGWDRWDRASAPRPAPLPAYQRQYSGDRYPHAEEQRRSIRQQNYTYAPHEAVTRQHFQQQGSTSRARTTPQSAAPAQDRPPKAQQQPERRKVAPAQDSGRNSTATSQDRGRPAAPAQQDKARQRPPGEQAAEQGRSGRAVPAQKDRPSKATAPAQETARQGSSPAQERPGRAASAGQDRPGRANPPSQDKARQAPPPSQDSARQTTSPPPDRGPRPAAPSARAPAAEPSQESRKQDRGQEGR